MLFAPKVRSLRYSSYSQVPVAGAGTGVRWDACDKMLYSGDIEPGVKDINFLPVNRIINVPTSLLSK